MNEIIEWLLSIERLAGTFYREVSEGFRADEKISKYFLHLSDEEAVHFRIMENALKYLKLDDSPVSSITVDDATKEKIEAPFTKNRELLSACIFSRENVLGCLAATEFSEWNYIFMYVVDVLKKERQFMSVAAKMQHHINEIEDFLKSLPEGQKYLPAMRGLPPVWHEQILVIDDEPSIVNFLKSLLEDVAQVETAGNGRDGLQKVKEKYFDVIITDIKMPVMDGLEFFKQASAYEPNVGERVLFFSGNMPDPDNIGLFKNNNPRFLRKPAPIREIMRHVNEIMKKPSEEA